MFKSLKHCHNHLTKHFLFPDLLEDGTCSTMDPPLQNSGHIRQLWHDRACPERRLPAPDQETQ